MKLQMGNLIRKSQNKASPSADPRTHLDGLHMKSDSEKRLSAETQAKLPNESKNPNSSQTSPTKETEDHGKQKLTEDESPTPPLPEHTVLIKDKELRANTKELAEKTDLLEAEYRSLLGYVTKNINKTRTVAQSEENKEHNRYTDIGKTCSPLNTKILSPILFQFRSTTTMSS